MARRGRSGFTLGEVLIVVIIIGILASVALPQFRKTVVRGYWNAAQDILQTTYSGEQVYEAANDTYVDPAACPAPDPAWRCIYMDNPNVANIPVTYTVEGVTKTTFTARATYTGAGGGSMTLNQDRTLDTTGWPMP